MSTELEYLTYATLLTALLWVPYTVNMISVRGLMDAVGYPENPAPLSSWAQRLKAAHYNAIENLVIFAALVLIANALDVTGDAIAWSSVFYFWARLVHAIAYTFAVPFIRTAAFIVGFGSQLCVAWHILFAQM